MKKIFSILITFFLLSHVANAQNGYSTDKNPNTKEELMKLIEETNKALPQSGGNGITLTKMYMDGDFVVNVNLVDEQTVTIAQIGAVKSIMKFP